MPICHTMPTIVLGIGDRLLSEKFTGNRNLVWMTALLSTFTQNTLKQTSEAETYKLLCLSPFYMFVFIAVSFVRSLGLVCPLSLRACSCRFWVHLTILVDTNSFFFFYFSRGHNCLKSTFFIRGLNFGQQCFVAIVKFGYLHSLALIGVT